MQIFGSEKSRDVFVMFLVILMNANLYLFSMYYPYLASLAKDSHPSVTLSSVYMAILFFFGGASLGNVLVPYSLRQLGLSKTIQLGGLLYLVNCVCWGRLLSWVLVVVNAVFGGVVVQFYVLATIIFFSEKYPKEKEKLQSIAFAATAACTIIWGGVLLKWVNPLNVQMNRSIEYQGQSENVFPFEIAKNLRSFFDFHGGVVFVLTFIVASFVPNPEKYPNTFLWPWEKRPELIICDSVGELDSEVKIKATQELRELSLPAEFQQKPKLPNPSEVERSNDGKTESLLSDNQSPLSASPFSKWFIALFVVSTLRNASIFYTMANAKVLGFLAYDDDKFVTTVMIYAVFLNLGGRLVSGAIWNYLGFYRSYYLCFVLNAVMDLGFMVITSFPELFIPLIVLQQFTLGLNFIINYFSVFHIYGNEKGVDLMKVYDLNITVALFLGIILQKMFVVNGNFQLLFFAFALVELLGISVLKRYFGSL